MVRSYLKEHKGFTAIELLIVMLAGVILIASGGKLASTLFDNARLASLEQNIQALRETIRDVYEPLNSYNGITPANLISTGRVPTALLSADKTRLVTPWGGSIGLASPSNRYFTVTVTGLPQAACLKLLQNSIGSWVAANGVAASGETDGVNPAAIAVSEGSNITRTWQSLITTSTYCSDPTTNTVSYLGK